LAAVLVVVVPGGAFAEKGDAPGPTTAPRTAPAEAGTLSEAIAATKTEEAKRLFADGSGKYAAGDFQGAAAAFETAYEITHAAELLYNLGRCYEHLGDSARAAKKYALYLRMSPDAEDRAEVEKRIAELEGDAGNGASQSGSKPDAAAPADGTATSDGEQNGEGRAIRLLVESGVDVPLLEVWERLSIPVDAVLLFGLNDWLHLGFGLGIAGFAGNEPNTGIGYPTGEFGLHGDLAVFKTIKGRVAFTARLSIAPTWIFRRNADNAFWLLARGGVGLHIKIWKSFGVLAEAMGGVGPVFCRDTTADWFTEKTSLAVDVGGRAGITYAF